MKIEFKWLVQLMLPWGRRAAFNIEPFSTPVNPA
jgi:hypothetical protein